MKRFGYTYIVVRYMHDVVSGECLNVAVILQSLSGEIEYKIPSSLARIKSAFPGADIDSIRSALDALGVNIKRYLSEKPGASISEVVSMVLPDDESSIRASKPGVGVCVDLSSAADDLLERFILCCDLTFDHVAVTKNSQSKKGWGPATFLNMPSNNDGEWEQIESRELRA